MLDSNFLKLINHGENQLTKANIVAKYFNVTQRTIERYMKQLKDENRVEFHGSPKTGGYYVK